MRSRLPPPLCGESAVRRAPRARWNPTLSRLSYWCCGSCTLAPHRCYQPKTTVTGSARSRSVYLTSRDAVIVYFFSGSRKNRHKQIDWFFSPVAKHVLYSLRPKISDTSLLDSIYSTVSKYLRIWKNLKHLFWDGGSTRISNCIFQMKRNEEGCFAIFLDVQWRRQFPSWFYCRLLLARRLVAHLKKRLFFSNSLVII